MVLGDHLSFELHQSVLDLRRIQFHDALHSPTCRASHLLTSLRHRRAGEFRWQRAHRSRSGSVAIFTVATTLTILAPTILSARIFAATKFPAGIFVAPKFTRVLAATKLWSVLATTILTTWATIALMVWASGGA